MIDKNKNTWFIPTTDFTTAVKSFMIQTSGEKEKDPTGPRKTLAANKKNLLAKSHRHRASCGVSSKTCSGTVQFE